MCGIAGFQGRFSEELLRAMTRRLAHRGPDDEGLFLEQASGIGLGHRRLSIIDLAPSGHQPMTDASGRYVIVFNGEIYNYRELGSGLKVAGHVFRGGSDTEVLLELFARRGLSCLDDVNGIFAFAIWDIRSRRLTVARDGLGVKPLYYAETSAGFLFASELKSLVLSKDVARDIDKDAIASYLTLLWAPAPLTPLKNVRKLLPGQALIVADGHVVETRTFYRLPTPTVQPVVVADAVDRLRSTLENSIRRQMVADVPVGAFLSGGLDSSTVVSFARKFSSTPLQCFTISYPESTGADGMEADLPYARRVAEYLGVPLIEVPVTPHIADDLPWMVEQLDEPQADPACLNAWYICQAAHKRGYKVLLSGAGGDDLLTGYRRHYALQSERLWSWLPLVARRCMAGTAKNLSTNNGMMRRAAKAFRYADLGSEDRLLSYFFWADPTEIGQMLGADVDPARILQNSLNSRSDIVRPLDKMLFLETTYFLGDHNLAYTDKMSMATGVEVRVPLIDKEMVACAATIPLELKQRHREGKWILKRAMARDLPRDVIYRPKTGFGVPLRAWLRGPLKPMLDAQLSDSEIASCGLFNGLILEKWKRNVGSGRGDFEYPLLAALCVQIWARGIQRVTARY